MEKITANIHEAKTNLSKLLKHVEAGDEVIIARGGTPIARLTALDDTGQKPFKRELGWAKGLIEYDEDWDSPETNEEIWKEWEENSIFPDKNENK